MIVAFDTYYYDGYSYTVGGVFESWADPKVKYYTTSKRLVIDAEYKSGELYKRELPCIMQCLSMINVDNIDTIIVDGFVWLSEDGKELTKGLGARLYDAIKEKYGFDISIVGVAKNPYHVDIPNCRKVFRGVESKKPLYVTCSTPDITEYYAILIRKMHGDNRIPTILKAIDSKSRECMDNSTNEEEKHDSEPINIDFGSFEEWLAETEKNGFRYR